MVFFCFMVVFKTSILFSCSFFMMKGINYGYWKKPASWSCVISRICLLMGRPPQGLPPPQGWSIPPCLSSPLCTCPRFSCKAQHPTPSHWLRKLSVQPQPQCLLCFPLELKHHFLVVSLCEIYNFLDCIISWRPASHWTNNFPIQVCPCHLHCTWKSTPDFSLSFKIC